MAQKWPVILYNRAGAYKVSDTPADLERNRSLGYTYDKTPEPLKFPTTLYARDGSTVVCENQAKKDQLLAEGFSEDHIAEAPAPKTGDQSSLGGELAQVILREISDLRARMDSLEATVTEPKKLKH